MSLEPTDFYNALAGVTFKLDAIHKTLALILQKIQAPASKSSVEIVYYHSNNKQQGKVKAYDPADGDMDGEVKRCKKALEENLKLQKEGRR